MTRQTVMKWTTIEEIKQQYPSMKNRGEKIKKGGLPVCQYDNKTYFDDSPVNNIILGMTRAGKGETFILLMIWLYCNAANKASLIINDPKEELYSMSYGQLKKNDYIPLVLNLDKPTNGIGFNPLDLVIQEWKKKNYSDAESLCLSIAETIYHPSRLEGEAKFWASTAASVFSAMCIAVVVDCLGADEKQNVVNAIEWRKRQKAFDRLRSEAKRKKAIEDYADMPDNEKLALPYIPSNEEFIPTHDNEDKINLFSVAKLFMDLASVPIGKSGKTALDVFFEERPSNDRAKMKFFSTQIAPDKTAASIYSSFFDALTVFTFEDVAKMTAKSTFNIYDIGFGENPYAIFLFTPDWDTSKHFLTNIFLDQVYFALSSRAAQTAHKRCDRDVMHILDEFGNIIPLSNISNKMSAGAGKGLLYTLIIQSYAQLEQYKENAKTIRDNCSNQVYILSADSETREEFSKAVGNETVTNVHRNGHYLSLDKEEFIIMTNDQYFNAISFIEKDIPIIVCGSSPSEWDSTNAVIAKMLLHDAYYIFNFCDKSEHQEILDLMQEKAKKTIFSDYAPDFSLFTADRNNLYKQIIKLENLSVSKPAKKGLFNWKRNKSYGKV